MGSNPIISANYNIAKMKRKQLIRQNFRDAVFKRDHYSCKLCRVVGSETTLDAHHITDRNEMPNGGYVKENGITVCKACHLLCEKYHISNKVDWHPGTHPDQLYKLIGSSYQKAVNASEKLK